MEIASQILSLFSTFPAIFTFNIFSINFRQKKAGQQHAAAHQVPEGCTCLFKTFAAGAVEIMPPVVYALFQTVRVVFAKDLS